MKTFKFIAALCGVAALSLSCEKEETKTEEVEKETVKVETVTLDKSSLNLVEEQEALLVATFSPAEAVATVSPDGKVKAVADGVATISVTAGAVKAVCQVTVQTPAKEWAVGDYYEVGSVKGVVVWVDESKLKGKIISLDETVSVWSTSNRYTGAQSTTDGKGNTAKVKALDNELTSFPAFKWCVDKGEGWYLPASDEVKCFLAAEPVVKPTLAAHGGTPLDSYYWSSTESDSNSETTAYWIYGYKGKDITTNSDSKTSPEDDTLVRAMYEF